ncbi:MAG: substrate-binding domain-containing protein [Desulfitobacterium hafniense]|nr:substrate-binding domain-containing protein [Desulfitobacterium hafniense]
MKSNKRYIMSSLTAQMIMIPVALTIGLFLVSSIIDTFLSRELGKDTRSLILLLIAFLGSLLCGGAVGYIFSKRSKNKPDSAMARYLPLLIPTIYALIWAILVVFFSKGNYHSDWWSWYVFKNPVFLIFDFVLFFMGYHFIVPVAELMGYTGFVVGILLHEIVTHTAITRNTSRNLKASFALLSVMVITISGITAKDVIHNGSIELLYGKSTIGSDLTEVDLMRIAPFKESNGLAKLDKPAGLQFTELDTMPRLDGATAAYPVYGAFVEAVYKGLSEYYEVNKQNHEKDVYMAFVASERYPLNLVKCSKTDKAYERLINGEADIIFVAQPSKAQIEMIVAKGDEFVLTPIGSEAFVFFTNSKNPVENLTMKQIQDIYSGKITNWKEVGGQKKSILPYQRPENSGSQTVMQNKVMKDIKMLEPTKETYASGMGDIISRVASYKNAKNSLGYSFMYYSSVMVRNNQIKYIAIDGTKPTTETVRNKTYPFTVPVYAVTLKSNTKENVNRFVKWILSEEGQSLVEKTGYIPVK